MSAHLTADSDRRLGVAPHRIALCITELDVGGAERFLVELATRLDRKQFAPAVYCLAHPPVGPGETLLKHLAAADVPVHCFGARGIGDTWRLLGQLRSRFEHDRPALLQTFLWHANVLGPWAARRLALDRDRRFGGCERMGTGSEPEGERPGSDDCREVPVPILSHPPRVPIVTGLRVAEPRRRWRWPLERIAGRWADRHVAVSEGVARFARERIGLAADKIVVVPSGIDIDRFPAPPADPQQLGLRSGRRFILFVGRLDSDDQKGAARFIEYASLLLNQLEGHDLVFAGDGPRLDALRRRTAELGLQDRVHWLGWRGDLPSILAAADLLVAPSRWEGMSSAVLEAMASGKPVVAQSCEGIADLLPDQAEQAVAAGDWLGFIDRIVALAGDAPLRSRLGAANRERAVSCFRLEETVRCYERLYSELI